MDNDLFTLSGNRLRTGQAFDYEAGRFYSVKVEVTDVGGATFQQELPIFHHGLKRDTPLYQSFAYLCTGKFLQRHRRWHLCHVDPDRHVTRIHL